MRYYDLVVFLVSIGVCCLSAGRVSQLKPSQSLQKVSIAAECLQPSDLAQCHDNQRDQSSTENSIIRRSSIRYRLSILLRAFYLISLFLPVLLLSVIAFFSTLFSELIWFPLLRTTIGYSGAAFIKWGQWASTRSDMFPEGLCRELSKLQAQAPTHSFSYTQQQVEKELGIKLWDRFEVFETAPIASGSIAQVHRAVLDQQMVAVKVRHPNVHEQINQDFVILSGLASFIDLFPNTEWLKLKESLVQFSDKIASQTNLAVEGDNLSQFNKNFESAPDINFPAPIIQTESVLVETFFTGESVAKFIETVGSDEENNLDLAHFVVTRGEDLYLQMLLQDNFMHADLHPGNILLTYTDHHHHQLPTYGVKRFDKHHTLALVDAGMVALLSKEQRINFVGLLEAIGEGDGRLAAVCVSRFSSYQLDSNIIAEFEQEVVELFKQVARGYGTNVDVGTVLRGILELVRKFRITIDANYATLVMNALCLDSMAKALLPTYNVMDAARPLLRLFRRSKRLPGVLVDRMWNIALKAMFMSKKRSDRRFLERLKSQPPHIIQNMYSKKS